MPSKDFMSSPDEVPFVTLDTCTNEKDGAMHSKIQWFEVVEAMEDRMASSSAQNRPTQRRANFETWCGRLKTRTTKFWWQEVITSVYADDDNTFGP